MSSRAWMRHGALHPDRRAPAYASLDEAHAAGRRDGVAATEARLAAEFAAAGALAARLEAALAADVPSLAPAVEACVRDLVTAIVGEAVAAGEGLGVRIAAALAALQADADAVLLLHPDDAARLDPAPAQYETDPALARGDILVRSGDAELADRIAARLAALA